jgi:hypothetical protein
MRLGFNHDESWEAISNRMRKKEERRKPSCLALAFFLSGSSLLQKPVVNSLRRGMSLQLNYALLFMQALIKAKKNKPFEQKNSRCYTCPPVAESAGQEH